MNHPLLSKTPGIKLTLLQLRFREYSEFASWPSCTAIRLRWQFVGRRHCRSCSSPGRWGNCMNEKCKILLRN
jgi:hypothetical protein